MLKCLLLWRHSFIKSSSSCSVLSTFQGQYKFKCPALQDSTLQKCDEVWSYQEVRRLAVLTAEEMQYFEENMARLAAAEYCEFKSVSVPVLFRGTKNTQTKLLWKMIQL